MSGPSDTSNSMSLSCTDRVNNLEKSLHKCFEDFKELKTDFEKIYVDSESYKSKFLIQKEKCEKKICSSADLLNKAIEAKNKIIQFIASNLSKLKETKNFAIIEDIFKVILDDRDIDISPNTSIENIKIEKITPEKGNKSIIEDISFNEGGNEIVDTPSGRTSPIIHSKVKSKGNNNTSDHRDKKKCPDSWPTPDKKTLKLLYPTPSKNKGSGKMRQMRLSYIKTKQTSVVDLTCSPEFSGGVRCTRSESVGNYEPLVIKKESIEAEDTIMPSPTSGPTKFMLFKSTTRESPAKQKKSLSLKIKMEKENDSKINMKDIKRETLRDEVTYLEDSPIISKRVTERLLNDLKQGSPVKVKQLQNTDTTHCDNSLSILQQSSPCKRPLVENVNAVNVQAKERMEESVSLLRAEAKINKTDVDSVKRKIPESNEPIFKEPAIRNKSEKRALPGWICDECKNFYGDLYEDNPLMLEKMIDACSKHRGRRNPARPKTPPNFWNPRWDVPEDTEELNRMNNAI